MQAGENPDVCGANADGEICRRREVGGGEGGGSENADEISVEFSPHIPVAD